MWRLGAHFGSSPGGFFSRGASSATGLSNSIIGPVPGRQSRHQLYSFVEEPNCSFAGTRVLVVPRTTPCSDRLWPRFDHERFRDCPTVASEGSVPRYYRY